MLKWLIGGDPAKDDRVESQPLKITTAAGMAGALVAIAGAIPAIVDIFRTNTLNDVQLAAAMGLVGAGALALAIAWGADSIARAYASAWVTPNGGAGHPAAPVVQALADAVRGGQRPIVDTNKRKVVVQPFAGLAVHAHGDQKEHVLAMEFDAEEHIRYLVAAENGNPEWVDGDSVHFVAV